MYQKISLIFSGFCFIIIVCKIIVMEEKELPTNRDLIEKRRTFAIISHPDAGKTTLTEKLLLYTGTIQTAGSVKGKKSDKHAVSDWMQL